MHPRIQIYGYLQYPHHSVIVVGPYSSQPSLGRMISAPGLPRHGRSCIKAPMQMGTQTSKSRSAILDGATVRALASTLLLLGLIGDRRAR